METLTVATTYGQALFDAAKDSDLIAVICDEYKAVSKVFEDNPLLKRLFLVPTLSAMEKRSVAGKIFEGRISRELLNFIYVLIDKRRIGAWEEIGRHYEKLVWERDGLTKGILYTALPAGPERVMAFEEKTGEALGKTVKLENRIDKSILGGAVIYVDGKLIDASLKSRLESMKHRMKYL